MGTTVWEPLGTFNAFVNYKKTESIDRTTKWYPFQPQLWFCGPQLSNEYDCICLKRWGQMRGSAHNWVFRHRLPRRNYTQRLAIVLESGWHIKTRTHIQIRNNLRDWYLVKWTKNLIRSIKRCSFLFTAASGDRSQSSLRRLIRTSGNRNQYQSRRLKNIGLGPTLFLGGQPWNDWLAQWLSSCLTLKGLQVQISG